MLKFGILGAANIAPAALIKPAHRTGRAQVVAVAARDSAKAADFAKKHKIPRVLDSYEALLADPDIDAVYVPLPNGLHGHWTIAALQAGKHVLCEKPFTANADEARQVAEADSAHPGLVVMEAFHYQYHPMTKRLVEIVQSGELGIIKEIDISFSAPLAKKGDIRYQLGLAGGATMDMGCYPISLLRLLAAGPRVISAKAKLSSAGVDRAMDARFSLPEGGTARVRCSMFSSSLLRLHAEVIGSEGTLTVFNPFAPQFGHRVKVQTASGTRREKFSRRATYDYQLEAFVAAVEDGAPFATTAVDAIRTMELIDAIYTAAGLGIRQTDGLMPLSADDLSALTDAALSTATSGGCAHAELRVERIHSQEVRLRDAAPDGSADSTELGMGVRVVVDGAVGFAATVDVRPEEAVNLVRLAIDTARVTAQAGGGRVELAPEPSHGVVEWSSAFVVDPGTVPLSEKVALLENWSHRLYDDPIVSHVTASVLSVSEQTYLADLNGTRATQHRVRLHPQLEALALSDGDGVGDFETMRTLAPPVGRGWEYLTDGPEYGWDWHAELAQIPSLLAEKLAAPSVEAGTYDLVIDPSNLWLTIHESIGHATELDRAVVGYEAAYAGTSFATFDQLGSLHYGSPVMHVTGDRTVEHGLATVAIDSEGVAGQSFDLIRGGTLVGYQLDRSIAASMTLGRSNGCAFADSPLHVPIQRMANVSLAHSGPDGPTTADLIAGVERGIYVVGDKSWSIDMQRYNFQFTGQRFFAIVGGKVVGQVRDVAYQATTTEFWGAMEAVGGASTYVLGGAFNCGKGQPGQVAPVSHGCPSVLVRGVRVLNAREEAGR